MKKELITFDQLAALSFLKFVKLDGLDITLLMKGIKNIADVKVKDDTDEYFIMSDGFVILEKSYINKFERNVDIELFDSLCGSKVLNYINNLDMFEFVLRKIKLLSDVNVDENELNDSLSFLQKNTMKQLYKGRYIVDYYCKDDEEYKSVRLTKRGELYLYLIDNKDKIEEFNKLLEINGYDSSLLESFLIVQDLNEDVSNILTLNNFANFCDEYNLDIDKSNGTKKKQRLCSC